MSKDKEIAYLSNLAKILNVPYSEVEYYHVGKPFSDAKCGYYLMDVGQIMMMLPPSPARVLDLGVGSGWTSEMFARSGYSVLGLDIAPDMIKIAQQRNAPQLDLRFEVHDYEASIDFGLFDAVVIYDALHHATSEASVIANCFHCLKPNGVFITMEPGVGHSTTPESLDAIKNLGTTEKDMEYTHQAKIMREAGFGTIRQYLRLNQLPLENVAINSGDAKQYDKFKALIHGTANGLTSLVVAVKDADAGREQLEPIMALNRGKSISIQSQEEYERSQSQLQHSQAEYERLHSYVQYLQAEYERLNSYVQHVQAESERSQTMIDAMKTSKFWKIRTQWFKLKKLMGLKTDD